MSLKLANHRVIVTGAAGMVGRALVAKLAEQMPQAQLMALTRQQCDLMDLESSLKVFEKFKPDLVFHLAAKVGGIQANSSDPLGFLQTNLMLNTNVLQASAQTGVKKLLIVGSSCIYPRLAEQPIQERSFLQGALEPTNEGYALAKIVGLRMAQYYHAQKKLSVVCPVPAGIYGPGDSYDLENSHVLSALVRRFVDAQEKGIKQVSLWGTGKAIREFIYLDDAVSGLIFMMEQVETSELLNLGSGQNVSIKQLAELIANEVGYSGEILWDTSKPDGMPIKVLDSSKLGSLGFKAQVPLAQGIQEVVRDYRASLGSVVKN